MDRWTQLSDAGRKFVVLSAAAVLGGLLVGPLMSEPLPSMAVAAVAAVLVVAVLWFSEGAGVSQITASAVAFAAGATCTLSLAPWGGETMAWLAAVALLSVACRPAANASDEEVPSTRIAEHPEDAADQENRADEAGEAGDDADSTQIRKRSDGVETIEGVTRCNAGINHVVFHPPLRGEPQAEAYGLDEGCRVSVAAATRHGLRLTVRGTGRVAYEVSASEAPSISNTTGP